MEDKPVIKVSNITKFFGESLAIRDISFDVRKGEIFGLVGPDGAGKSTILRILASILLPSSGEAFISGFSIWKDPERIKERIAYMPARFGLYEDLTVIENLHFYADIYGVKEQEKKERAERLLEFAGLLPFKKRLAGKLSGGMKQKLGLACALIHRPEILLLDEPTTGVDPISRRELWIRLSELLKEGITVVLTTPYLDEAERCTRVGLIHKGRLLFVSEPEKMKEILHQPVLEIVASDVRSLIPQIKGIEGVEEITLFGDRLHLRVSDRDVLERIERAFELSSVKVDRIKIIKPSLEDIFIFLSHS